MTEQELVEEMGRERHRGLKIWDDAMQFAKDVYAHSAKLKASIMSLTMSIRAYDKTLR